MKRKVVITGLPKAESGLSLSSGSFNYKATPWDSMNNSGSFSQPNIKVGDTLQPVPRHEANLEAEKGEIAMTMGEGGVPSTFKVGGQRHSNGGTPLSLPEDSFIFSDTRSMKIKDREVLDQFGMGGRKGGYTPAEIAKKYPINNYKKFLADPDADDLQRDSAELMISNYNLKLAKLGLIQESMKGFPQGIPMIAMPYIESLQIDPAMFAQMDPQGQQPTVDDAQMARLGGRIFQTGGNTGFFDDQYDSEDSPTTGAYSKPAPRSKADNMSIDEIYRMQQELLPYVNTKKGAELYNQYDKKYKERFAKGERISQGQPGTEPTMWVDGSGTRYDTPAQGTTGYWDRVGKNFIHGVNEQAQKVVSSIPGDANWGNEQFVNDPTIDPATLKGKVPTQAAAKTQAAVAKLKPSNSEGAFDYASNLFTMPQKGLNLAITGNYETPGTTMLRTNPKGATQAFITDVVVDPLNLVGVAEAKHAAKAAYKGGKFVVEEAVKYAPIIAEKAVQAAKYLGKNAEYAMKWIGKNFPNFVKHPVVRNTLRNGVVRYMASGSDEDKLEIQKQWWELQQEGKTGLPGGANNNPLMNNPMMPNLTLTPPTGVDTTRKHKIKVVTAPPAQDTVAAPQGQQKAKDYSKMTDEELLKLIQKK